MSDAAEKIAEGEAVRLKDMLRALENQRNASQTECVMLAAQVFALQREREALVAEIVRLRDEAGKDEAQDVEQDVKQDVERVEDKQPASNGHAGI